MTILSPLAAGKVWAIIGEVVFELYPLIAEAPLVTFGCVAENTFLFISQKLSVLERK